MRLRSATVALYALSLLAACRTEMQKNMQTYIEKLVPVIMEQQERKFNVKHYGQPKLIAASIDGSAIASYNTETDVLKMDPSRSREDFDVRRAVSHELGHYYSNRLLIDDGIAKGLNADKALNIRDHRNRKEVTRKLLVGEGIAEYFSRNLLNWNTDCSRISLSYDLDSDRFATHMNWSPRWRFYDNAYCLAKPILDADLKRGIVFLATHPPEESELGQLREYQQRSLDKFRKIAE